MPNPITEFLNGGLVTNQHAALYNAGELQQCDDCVMRWSSIAIQRAPGRTAYNSSVLSAGTKGLMYLNFDQNTDQLIAWPQGDGTTSYLYKSDFTTITGSFTPLTGAGTISANTNSNTTISGAASGAFQYMEIGAKITGTGIPVGTYVTAIGGSPFTSITISNAATASATVTLAFDAGVQYGLADTSSDVLDYVQWQDTYFLLSKTSPTARVYWKKLSASSTGNEILTIRRAGLLPITEAPVVTVQAGAGWSSVLGNGYYWFLVTEILDYGDIAVGETEAGYLGNEGKAIVVQITSYATQYITVTFPTIKNDGQGGTNRATHWGIYMSVISPGVAAYSDPTNMPSLATFRRIAKVAIEETSRDIKFTNTSVTNDATTETTAGGIPAFVNPTRIFTLGNDYAAGTSGGANTQQSVFAGFGFSAGAPFSGYAVTGISVTLIASAGSFNAKAGFYVTLDNNGAKSSNRVFSEVSGIAPYPKTLGSQFDTWGQTWTASDISNLRIILLKSYSASTQILRAFYLLVKVYYSGAALDTGSLNLDGPPYQVVTYRSQIGTTINDPANYLIPSASTGDVFQGSLVLNDTSDPSVIRYSIPGAPESFPKPYLMKFVSKKKDIVTFIRKIGQILIVGMRDSIKRVNYLPTETDVDFQQGVADEDIVTDHGIVGPLAGCYVDLPGVGVVLAYVGTNGFYFTDGVTDRYLNSDIDITDIVKTSALSTSILRVYPKEKWLVFFYCPVGASHTKNTKAIIFSYSPTHIKDGNMLPGTGPLNISARAATEASIDGVSYILTGHQTTGTIYVEDSGNVQATNYQVHNTSDSLVAVPIVPKIKTRKLFAAGYARDMRIQRLYLLYDSLGSTVTASSTTTLGSAVVLSSTAFGSVVVGMYVTGTGIKPGTIVITKTSSSNITLSETATATSTTTLTFDNGTIATTIRGSGIRNTTIDLDTIYSTTRVGDILVQHHDHIRQGLELVISKVVLPSGLYADLDTALAVYNFTYLADDASTEMNRPN